ncbi:MAG: hypothetical protein IKO48_02980 [Elusimicrobia bacterium]|nr:hypothetical protein [Elusimicrobiota bacterium]
MGNIIKADDFLKKTREEIISDKKIENYNLVNEAIKNRTLNNYFEDCSDTKTIIPILQKVNEYFLKNYEINIDKDLIMRPIETEIYFANDLFYDGMCHKNELQKGKDDSGNDRFGKLYFHRYKDTECSKIICMKTKMGGMDICLADVRDKNNYYLSILIRSAFINDKIFSGINNICKEIMNKCNIDEEYKLKKMEESIVLVERKEENKVKQSNIFLQQRIFGRKYDKGYKLNCLNYNYLNEIIETKQTFYNVPKNIQRIKNCFENKKN